MIRYQKSTKTMKFFKDGYNFRSGVRSGTMPRQSMTI
jgi:hypothetical protein